MTLSSKGRGGGKLEFKEEESGETTVLVFPFFLFEQLS